MVFLIRLSAYRISEVAFVRHLSAPFLCLKVLSITVYSHARVATAFVMSCEFSQTGGAAAAILANIEAYALTQSLLAS